MKAIPVLHPAFVSKYYNTKILYFNVDSAYKLAAKQCSGNGALDLYYSLGCGSYFI
jgi:hypothetical protein